MKDNPMSDKLRKLNQLEHELDMLRGRINTNLIQINSLQVQISAYNSILDIEDSKYDAFGYTDGSLIAKTLSVRDHRVSAIEQTNTIYMNLAVQYTAERNILEEISKLDLPIETRNYEK